ncbi:PREDICTED: ejaculatory bulb-specific protein 3-like [Vollenhovia emeryi]|uniref:ejaculatory bulb-specific protein 3-like n=1 Tax=Vollenhovia emeryi TaxID=411798 RepID=UPI0005F3CE09|nr:PREDICTED: ejaculatory bulb-specific protein 3-like [Vollenhovia emeryi]
MARLSYIVIIGVALACALAEELYSDRYDDVDVSSILQNDKKRAEYYGCLMDTSPCITGDAKFLKEVYGEAVLTNCKKCTEKQKNILNAISDWYTTNRPDEWNAVVAKITEEAKKKNAGT